MIASTLTPLAAAPPAVTVVTPPANPSVQQVTLEPGVTTFTLSVDGVATEGIPGGADAAAIEAALEALATVVDATVTGNVGGPFDVVLNDTTALDPTIVAAVTDPLAQGVVDRQPEVGFFPADPDVARIAFQLAQEQHTTRKFHDPTYVAGGPVDPANDRCPVPPRSIPARQVPVR